MKLAFAVVVLSSGLGLAGVSGCTDRCEDSRCVVTPDTDQRYLRLADDFDDASQCPTNGLPNCYQIFELCENGAFRLVLTDIIEAGKYVRDEDQLLATLYLPSGTILIRATVDDASGTMDSADLAGRHPWQRVELDTAAADQLAESCTAIEGRSWF